MSPLKRPQIQLEGFKNCVIKKPQFVHPVRDEHIVLPLKQ